MNYSSILLYFVVQFVPPLTTGSSFRWSLCPFDTPPLFRTESCAPPANQQNCCVEGLICENGVFKRGTRKCSFFLCLSPFPRVHRGEAMRGHSDTLPVYKPGRKVTRDQPNGSLISGFQPPELWGVRFCCLSSSVCGDLLQLF